MKEEGMAADYNPLLIITTWLLDNLRIHIAKAVVTAANCGLLFTLSWLSLSLHAGFNAVRVPMNFTNLQRNIPKPKSDGTEFYPCMVSVSESKTGCLGRGGLSSSHRS